VRVLEERLAANKELGERIRAKQQAFKDANPEWATSNFIEFDEEDEEILNEVWDEEGKILEKNLAREDAEKENN